MLHQEALLKEAARHTCSDRQLSCWFGLLPLAAFGSIAEPAACVFSRPEHQIIRPVYACPASFPACRALDTRP